MEDKEDRPKRRNSSKNGTKVINLSGNPTRDDLKDATREQVEDLAIESIKAMAEMHSEMNKMRTSYEVGLEKAYQELEMNSHEIDKRKIVTLFDVITNTKELLTQRINEHGKADHQYTVDEGTRMAANNVIKLCLKQTYKWIHNNDINNPKLKKDEKNNESQIQQNTLSNNIDITAEDQFKSK